ncbi:MAG: CocE/NonD family hydrolase [Asgard group archaeon]|nr:CocE/NonD family hydrolase [Asgard group archaeon]
MKVKFVIAIMIFSFCIGNPLLVHSQYSGLQEWYTTEYDKTTLMIEMRDGVNLATDVYIPNWIGDGTRGTVLIRTPYDKNGMSAIASIFTSLQGYVTIIQDMRGRFASEGIDMVFQNASVDGYDTIEWILQQEWSNGKVVTWGPSALGINQYFINLNNPNGLVGQAIQIASPDLYNDIMYPGGAFREALVVGWLSGIDSTFWLPIIYDNENYGHIWKNVTMAGKFGTVTRPAIFQAGWFDVFSQGTIDGFMGYQYESDPSVQGKSFMVIGPWGHGTYFSQEHGELTFPENAVTDYYEPLLFDFLEYYLRDDMNSLYSQPKVRYYCMGPTYENATGNFWRSADVWPIPVNYTKYYLHENGFLHLGAPNTPEIPDSYLYDPNNPVPTLGGCNLNLPYGPHDQSSLESREDIFVYTSDAFDEKMEITGSLSAHLWVSSNCTDTDFTVKITDVYPDGKSMLIQDGIVRAKYRDNRTDPELLTPGEKVEVDINLWSTSYVFNPGHKIRVAISSSNYPRFSANPNNGAPIFTNNDTHIANNTIYHDDSHQSYITLPINEDGTYPEPPTPTPTETSPSLGWLGILAIEFFIPLCMIIINKNKKKINVDC